MHACTHTQTYRQKTSRANKGLEQKCRIQNQKKVSCISILVMNDLKIKLRK